jgi:signal transduction histidine kinase
MKHSFISFDGLLKSPGSLIFVLDSSGRVLQASDSLCQMLDYPLSQVIGSMVFDFLYLDDVDQAQTIFNVQPDQFIGKTSVLRFLSKPKILYCMNCTVLRHDDFYVWMLSDVSAFKQAEETLEKKSHELKELNRNLDEFVHVASHDLRAPLRGIRLLVSWLEEDLAKRDFHAVEKHLEHLKRRTLRMDALLTGLLEYSLIGRQPAEVSEVDCASLLKNIESSYTNGKKHLELRLQSSFPILKTCAHSLEVVFKNLIENSIRHSPGQKIVVSINVTEDGNFWKFSVVDDGPGIPLEYQDRVFEAFKTLRPRDEVEGTGLGLSIVKKIVESFGAAVAIDPRHKGGTKVDFTWPKA